MSIKELSSVICYRPTFGLSNNFIGSFIGEFSYVVIEPDPSLVRSVSVGTTWLLAAVWRSLRVRSVINDTSRSYIPLLFSKIVVS